MYLVVMNEKDLVCSIKVVESQEITIHTDHYLVSFQLRVLSKNKTHGFKYLTAPRLTRRYLQLPSGWWKLGLTHGGRPGGCRENLGHHQTYCYICNRYFHSQVEVDIISTTKLVFRKIHH